MLFTRHIYNMDLPFVSGCSFSDTVDFAGFCNLYFQRINVSFPLTESFVLQKYAYPADELMPLSCRGRVRGQEPNRGDIDESLGK